MSYPDLVIYVGIRSIMSMVGVLVTAASIWYYERKWDEEGSAAYAKVLDENSPGDYKIVEEGDVKKKYVTNADGSRDAISVSTQDVPQEINPTVQVPREILLKAYPFPIGTVLGLLVWTTSFLFLPGSSIQVHVGWNLSWLLLLPAVAILISFHFRFAVVDRKVDFKKKSLSTMLVLSLWLIGSAIVDKETSAPWYFPVAGAFFLFFSYHTMRRSRKMGLLWELEGRVQTEVAAQNLGALTMILGFYLLWIGTNVSSFENAESPFIPVYLNYRAWLVFVAAFFMIIPGSVALDYAFDRGSKPNSYDSKERLMKLDGTTFEKLAESMPHFSAERFAGFLETPWIVVAGWSLFGLSAFMPLGGQFTAQKLFACLFSFIIGIVYGLRVLPMYWKGDLIKYRRWTYIYYGSMVLLFTTIGVDGKVPLICAMLGVIILLLGEHIFMSEKKKGKRWLHHGETKSEVAAFTYGHPVNLLGWLLLCMAMAIPMDRI